MQQQIKDAGKPFGAVFRSFPAFGSGKKVARLIVISILAPSLLPDHIFGGPSQSVGAAAAVPQVERDALIALYGATNGASWKNRTNWLGAPGTEGTWYGVNVSSDHVTAIDLADNNLVGQLPPELGTLSSLE